MCWLHASRSTAVIINADLIMKKNNAHKCIISVKNMPWAAYNFIPIVMYVCVCMEYYKNKFYRKKEGSKWWWKNHCLLKPIWIIMAHGLLVKCVCVHCFFPLFSFVPSRWCHYGDYKFKIQMISLSTGPSQARMKVEITKLALGCSVGVSEKTLTLRNFFNVIREGKSGTIKSLLLWNQMSSS